MTQNTFDPKNSTAAITGASSGIGYELAKKFAAAGFDLIVAAENPEIEEAAIDFRRMGVEVEAVQVDLSDFDAVEKLYHSIRNAPKTVEVVAMNAGVGVGGEFAKTELEKELCLVRLNIDSLIHLSKRIVPDFIQRGRGRILFTSSLAAEMPGPYYAVYAASKAFVQSFAEALRIEVKDQGVIVTALQPGATETQFFARANMLNTAVGASKKDSPSDVAP